MQRGRVIMSRFIFMTIEDSWPAPPWPWCPRYQLILRPGLRTCSSSLLSLGYRVEYWPSLWSQHPIVSRIIIILIKRPLTDCHATCILVLVLMLTLSRAHSWITHDKLMTNATTNAKLYCYYLKHKAVKTTKIHFRIWVLLENLKTISLKKKILN